ncbi:chloride channel protein ClC-Kb-like [Lampetra planeri]
MQHEHRLLDNTDKQPWPKLRGHVQACLRVAKSLLMKTGEDWWFLFALGMLMALISFTMDFTSAKLQKVHRMLFDELQDHRLLQWVAWVSFPMALTAFSTGFAQSVSPASGGSGIPELKTILGGVVLEEYLSIRTFAAKVIGLTCTLSAGSTIFLGKVGPFVHISSMLATFLGRVMTRVAGTYENAARQYEMLVAAAAVGVGCCFGAPVSGVLFSVEVMSSHFAVRDYWRGFFAASCGALMFRILSVLNKEQETIVALFKTQFLVDFPFDLPELFFFALLGVICGGVSCAYLYCQRTFFAYVRKNKVTAKLLASDKALYSTAVAFLLAVITFPPGFGQFMAARLTMKELLTSMFDRDTWFVLSANRSADLAAPVNQSSLWLEWANPDGGGVFATLCVFIVMKFWMLILATTMPLPAGYFMPVFVYGAALGRLVGEVLAYIFPNGIKSEGTVVYITPGGYALAGAAAFSGAVTHTVSTAMLVFEVTGQIAHILPVLVAVLVANAIAQKFQPSFYDGTIMIKKLPYLPKLRGAGRTGAYGILVEQFMNTKISYLTRDSSERHVKKILKSLPLTAYPVVDADNSMILVGAVRRPELVHWMRNRAADGELESPKTLDGCDIEPITFQLSPKTSLYQAHKLFELLGLQFIYVTSAGRLVGAVTLAELRRGMEDLISGKIVPALMSAV